jgi:CRISPR/Cas system CSM-associated protein Csm3 (group 7 of RAMP superfamily)
MIALTLKITLLSDATLGRGDGVAGLVDAEVQHDHVGCPYLLGRTIKGMLREEFVNILYALRQADIKKATHWEIVANALLGTPGSKLQQRAALMIGDATLPADLHDAITAAVEADQLTHHEVLDALTAIRQQTAVDAVTGAPRKETLRAARVIVRGTTLQAPLQIDERQLALHGVSSADALALLAGSVAGWRRAGSGRNRGRGEIQALLGREEAGRFVNETPGHLEYFAQGVLKS